MCEFALKLEDQRVINASGQHNIVAAPAKRRLWNQYFGDTKKNGVYAEEPVLYCLACMLGRDLIVVSQKCSLENASGNAYPPILLANIAGVHFQSLLPTENFEQYYVEQSVPPAHLFAEPIDPSSLINLSFSASSITKSAAQCADPSFSPGADRSSAREVAAVPDTTDQSAALSSASI